MLFMKGRVWETINGLHWCVGEWREGEDRIGNGGGGGEEEEEGARERKPDHERERERERKKCRDNQVITGERHSILL